MEANLIMSYIDGFATTILLKGNQVNKPEKSKKSGNLYAFLLCLICSGGCILILLNPGFCLTLSCLCEALTTEWWCFD